MVMKLSIMSAYKLVMKLSIMSAYKMVMKLSIMFAYKLVINGYKLLFMSAYSYLVINSYK